VGSSILRKLMFGLLLALVTLTACAQQQAQPQKFTGEEQHERHATGMESQAKDM